MGWVAATRVLPRYEPDPIGDTRIGDVHVEQLTDGGR
jgi:hypothetical protein